MEKIIEMVQSFMGKVDFLELGSTLSPAVYILAAGAILIIVGFFIALGVKSGSKANKFRKHLDDTVAFVNANGTIDAENVDQLNARIQDSRMPLSVAKGWGAFLEQQIALTAMQRRITIELHTLKKPLPALYLQLPLRAPNASDSVM